MRSRVDGTASLVTQNVIRGEQRGPGTPLSMLTDPSKYPGTMIWIFGPDAQCRTVSKAWLKFRGRTAAQERGEGWLEGVHPEDKARCIEVLRSAFLFRQFFQTKFRILRADGSYAWVLGHGVPQFLNDGSFLGYCGELQEVGGLVSDRSGASQYVTHQSLRDCLQQITTNSANRIPPGKPASPKRRRRMNSMSASTLVSCLNMCSTPVLALDREGRVIFSNTAAQLFAAKHAPAPIIEKLTATRARLERQSAVADSELGCTQAVNEWLDSFCTIDLRDVRISAQPLANGLIAFSIIDTRAEQEPALPDRAFLHDLLNVATGVQVLLDILLEERISPSEEAECTSLLRSSLIQLLSAIEQQRLLLDRADRPLSEAHASNR